MLRKTTFVICLSLGACLHSKGPEIDEKPHGVEFGGPVAAGIVKMLNDESTTVKVLDDDVGLDVRAAKGLIARRDGADATFGTGDDQLFEDLEEVDAVSYVGNSAIGKLAKYAEANGWVVALEPSGDVEIEGVLFSAQQAANALKLVNEASLTELDDDVGLNKKAAENIVAGRPISTLQELGKISYVGKTALEAIKAYGLPKTIQTEKTNTVSNLKIAFVGDSGLSQGARDVFKLIKNEGADATVHLGDFDYQQNPPAWNQMIDDELGSKYPFFGVVGNHDLEKGKWPEYQADIKARLDAAAGVVCTGETGVNATCSYKGLEIVISGVGVKGSAHEAYLQNQLATSNATWKICAWHRNMHDMQAGGKTDQTGWAIYQICQNGGGIIATAHEHSYSRTRTLTDVGNGAQGHGAVGAPDQLEVAPGKTFAFVSGLGGKVIRDYHAHQHDDDTWWATILASNHYLKNGVEMPQYIPNHGALFITFHVDGDPKKAKGEFKTIDGQIVDSFTITTP